MTGGPDRAADADRLPVDPDVEVVDAGRGGPRPVHLRPGAIGLVGLGGAVGTATRALLTRAGARWVATPYITMAINLVGAFVLGALLSWLAGRGPDHGRRQRVRLFVGTGVLGGFTTYSSLSVDVAGLGGAGHAGTAAAVGLITLGGGAITSLLGILLGTALGSARRVAP